MMTPLRTVTAWSLIGWDDGAIRIHGGRAIYEAVMFNCAGRQNKVKLARLDTSDGLREVSRYVDPDTLIDVLEDSGRWDFWIDEQAGQP